MLMFICFQGESSCYLQNKFEGIYVLKSTYKIETHSPTHTYILNRRTCVNFQSAKFSISKFFSGNRSEKQRHRGRHGPEAERQGNQPHDQGEGAVHGEPAQLRHVQEPTRQGAGRRRSRGPTG
jgi:hypothetical protein